MTVSNLGIIYFIELWVYHPSMYMYTGNTRLAKYSKLGLLVCEVIYTVYIPLGILGSLGLCESKGKYILLILRVIVVE